MSTKNLAKLLPVVMITLLFAACKPAAKTPTAVTTDFFAALSAGDFSKAKTMVTEDAKESISNLELLAADKVKGKKYTVTKEEINGENATVSYKEDGKEGEKTMKLKKVKDEWKVAFDKNEFTGTTDDLNKGMEGVGAGMDSLGASVDSMTAPK
jgi:hypothetical protein